MITSNLKPGDRVDYRSLKNGEVIRVGRATIWAVFETPHGTHPVTGSSRDFRSHEPSTAVRIGEYILRTPAYREGHIQVHAVSSGEMMETDIAKLESWLAKFWRREF